MQRVKRNTAVAVMPAPPAGGTAGFFAKPDPTNGVPATVPGYEWHNNIQEELVGVVLAAGLALSDTDQTQLVQALIKKGMQAGYFNYAVDTGSANVYQVAYTPAITALTDGMVLRFRAKTANTGASTFSPNGLAASPIWGADHAAIGGGEIVANSVVWVQWNSSLNGGAGAWVLVDSTGGYIKSPTAPQFDMSQKLATMAAVQRALGNYQGHDSYNTAAVAISAAQAGKVISYYGTANATFTLPTIASVGAAGQGASFSFVNTSSYNLTLSRSGASDTFLNSDGSSAGSSIVIGPGDTIYLVASKSGSQWMTIGGSAQLGTSAVFGVSKGTISGYQKLPSGLIIQWGTSSVAGYTAGASQSATFPITFPNWCSQVIPVNGDYSAQPNAVVCMTNAGANQSGFSWAANQNGSVRVTFVAFGW